MKKIIFSLFLFLFSILLVSADELTAVTKKYIVNIDGKPYIAHADYSRFCVDEVCQYALVDGGIALYDESGEPVDIIMLSEEANLMDYYMNMGLNVPFSYRYDEQAFYDDSAMSESLPKFIRYDNKIYVYSYDKNLFDGDYQEFDLNEILEYTFQVDFDEQNSIYVESVINNHLDNFDHSYESIDLGSTGSLTSEQFRERAIELRELLEQATDIDVCTEYDLNAIRTQRMVSFIELDKYFTAPLSSSCYNLIFGENGLHKKALNAFGDVRNYSRENSAYNYTMSFLFFETYYQQAYSFLSGSVMQVEPSEVLECGFFGEKTVNLLQSFFDILKFAGIAMGILLAVVDIFKAVVSQDSAAKKSLQTMMKRLAAIVALMLTPFLIELIFDIVNTIGVTDPICGIR